MPTYNPNDFYPRTGQEIKSDGTTANEADGINSDGSRNMVLIGAIARQTILNALAITDAVSHTGNAIDVTKYQKVALRVQNTHNQALTLYFLRGDTSNDTFYLADKTNATFSVNLPASMTKPMILTSVDYPLLQYVQYANVQVQASVAPTSGSVTVEVVGRN